MDTGTMGTNNPEDSMTHRMHPSLCSVRPGYACPAAALLGLWLLAALLLTLPAIAQETGLDPEPAAETEETEPAAEALDEIVVSASYSLNRSDPTASLPFSKEDIDKLPTFADDLYRAVALLPGTSGNDVSARFTVRGGPHEDVLVRLDGVELFEPFHLKDFAGVLSVIDPLVVDGLELLPGAFPASYGDRKTAVLDMTTSRPFNTQSQLGISLSTANVFRAGTFGDDDRSHFTASLRRGWLDVVLGLVGDDDEEEEQEGAPEYWDVYGKLEHRPNDRTDFALWALAADDSLDEEEREDGALEKTDSQYGNQWLVGRYQHLLSDRTVFHGRAFAGRVDRDRFSSEADGDTDFEVFDDRQLDVLGLNQEWSLQLGDRHLLGGGLEVRSYESAYGYRVSRAFTDPISNVGQTSVLDAFDGTVEGESYGVWLSDRWRLNDRAVAEVGVRWDRQTWLDDDVDGDQFSPRLNLVWDLGKTGTLRAGWGHAHQSQRPNELMVEDGDTTFYAAERAEHRTLGWERLWDGGSRLRVDLFQRLTDNPRPRYYSLFNPLAISPEGSPDRIRWDAEESRAQGLEVFYQAPQGKRMDWWVSYTWSEVEDRLDGLWTPRNIDQTHALTVNTSWRLGRRWNLDLVWLYHTGWPITDVTAQLVDGVVTPSLGPINGERVEDYHRLDLRASRTFGLGIGDLELYLDVQNLYNRENEQGFEFGEDAFEVQADGSVLVTPEVDTWLGIVPSFGLRWSF